LRRGAAYINAEGSKHVKGGFWKEFRTDKNAKSGAIARDGLTVASFRDDQIYLVPRKLMRCQSLEKDPEDQKAP
jgi:hypothetical protein